LKLHGKPCSKARNYAKKQAVTQDPARARADLRGFLAAFTVNRQRGGALRRFMAFVDKCNKTAETTARWSLAA